MSVSSIGPVSNAAQGSVLTAKGGTAPDGDPAAVEASESSKTKLAEAVNGGFAPAQSATPVTSAPTTSSAAVNKKV